jgi:lauroyl/myristoyl acyltransferase
LSEQKQGVPAAGTGASQQPMLLSTGDLIDLATFAGLLLPAWVLPEALWPIISSQIARVHVAARRRPRRDLDLALATLPGRPRAEEIERAVVANVYAATLQLLRHYRPGRYRLRLEVDGRQFVDEALLHGKGAILWVYPFTFSDLVTKEALFDAGFRVSHLSAVTHGYSNTKLGKIFLNRLRTRVEDRYIRERILLTEAGSVSALRLLRARLNENGIVSVTATHSGRRVFEIPLLQGNLKLANGAPSLAVSTGASLIPVFTLPNERRGFTTHICRPLVADKNLTRHEAEEEFARQYVDLLKPFVVRHPELWPGWLGSARWVAPSETVEVPAH